MKKFDITKELRRQMNYEFSGGIVLASIILVLVVAIPIKAGAQLANAQRTSIVWCGMAALLGFILAVRLMLGSSFLGAIGISIIAIVLAIGSLSVLSNLGVTTKTPVEDVAT